MAVKTLNSIINNEAVLNLIKFDCFHVNLDKEPIRLANLRSLIEKRREPGHSLLEQYRVNDYRWSTQYQSASGIKINNTDAGVKLTRILENGTEKTIDFQETLLKYVKKHHNFGENFVHTLIELQNGTIRKNTDTEDDKLKETYTLNEL